MNGRAVRRGRHVSGAESMISDGFAISIKTQYRLTRRFEWYIMMCNKGAGLHRHSFKSIIMEALT